MNVMDGTWEAHIDECVDKLKYVGKFISKLPYGKKQKYQIVLCHCYITVNCERLEKEQNQRSRGNEFEEVDGEKEARKVSKKNLKKMDDKR